MNWVLVTSAINSPYDKVAIQDRFQQTLETLKSVRSKLSPCRILLCETSLQALNLAQHQILRESADVIFEMHHDDTMQLIHQCADNKVNWIKTPGELLVLCKVLDQCSGIDPRDRIWKISGRYRISDDFDLQRHQRTGKICVLARRPAVTYFVPGQDTVFAPRSKYRYHSRFYSFCGSLLPTMRNIYGEMLQDVVAQYSTGRFNDIENVMFDFLQDLNPVELDPVGVCGQQADDLMFITE